MTAPLLNMQAITKDFPGVRALEDVSFEVRPRRNSCPLWGRKRGGQINVD